MIQTPLSIRIRSAAFIHDDISSLSDRSIVKHYEGVTTDLKGLHYIYFAKTLIPNLSKQQDSKVLQLRKKNCS
jgi:hypothetical protein